VHDILNNKKSKILLAIFFIYAFLFQLIAIWSQLALYAGCASKNIDKYYLFSGDYFCLDQIPLLFDHLAILGWPIVTIIGFGIGFILFFILFIKIWSYKDMGASERI